MSTTDAVSPPAGPTTPAVPEPTPAQAPAAAPAPAALREDQIANAIAFLTHPKVRESPQATKRSFLERKGLTAAEIDEAFKRVPEPSSGTAAATSSSGLASSGLITYQNQGGQTSQQATPAQPAVYQHAGQAGPYQQALVPAQQLQPPAAPPQPEPLRWSQVLLGVGVVAASVYAVKALLWPHAQAWYSSWLERTKSQREIQEKQAAILQEAAEALKACEIEMKANNETLASVLAALKEQQIQQNEISRSAELSAARQSRMLMDELSDLRQSLAASSMPFSHHQQQQHRPNNTIGSLFGEDRGYKPAGGRGGELYNGAGGYNRGGGSGGNYGNGHSWLGQGSSSSGRAQELSPEPMGASQSQSQSGGAAGQYPPSFQEVMEMVAKGITPPNVRTDIVDTPPDPSRPLPPASVTSQPKPWEQRSQYGPASTASGSGSPWNQNRQQASNPADFSAPTQAGMYSQPQPYYGSSSGTQPQESPVHSARSGRVADGESAWSGGVPRVGSSTSLQGDTGTSGPSTTSIFAGGSRVAGAGQVAPPAAAAPAAPSYPPVSVLQPSAAPWRPPPPPKSQLPASKSQPSVTSPVVSTAPSVQAMPVANLPSEVMAQEEPTAGTAPVQPQPAAEEPASLFAAMAAEVATPAAEGPVAEISAEAAAST